MTLEVCEAIVEGRNPASVILADMFTSLDSRTLMRGSPLLLQVTHVQCRGIPTKLITSIFYILLAALKFTTVLLQIWLEERLGYRIPRDTAKRCITEYISRPVALRIKGTESWCNYLRSLEETSVVWRLPVSQFTRWVNRLDGPVVYLVGTEEFTSYLPERIMRQFGERQRILPACCGP